MKRRMQIGIFERHPYRIRFIEPFGPFVGERYCSNILLVADTLLAYRGETSRHGVSCQACVHELRGQKWVPVQDHELDSMIAAARNRFGIMIRAAGVEESA